MLTKARSNLKWLKNGSSVTQQQTIRKFGTTANGFFKKTNGAPQFKTKKNQKVSLQYTKRGFSIRDGRLRLPNKVNIPVVWSRELPSEPSSVTVYQDSCGDWFASFVVEVLDTSVVSSGLESTLGTDFNVKTTVVATDKDYDLDFESQMAKHQRNYAKYQRRMATHRANREWKLYQKAKKKAAKEKRAEKRKRSDRYRKYAKKVAISHGFIAIDDLKVSFMTKSRMAKKTYDASIFMLKTFMQEACDKYGAQYKLVNPKNTTQDCCHCGARAKSPLTLADRVYHCSECHNVIDRDRNSAFNVLNRAGFNPTADEAVRLNGLLESYSLKTVKHADVGIPRL